MIFSHKKATSFEIVFISVALQFISALDFMLISPMGPFLYKSHGIDPSLIGYLSSAYTFSAAFSALFSSYFVDSLDRKQVAFVSVFGLSVATYLLTFADSFSMMIFFRVLAGMFGGPAIAITLAIVIDTVSEKMRARSISLVVGSFSVASILGVPLGLYFAEVFSWQFPFKILGCFGFLVSFYIAVRMPRMNGHIRSYSVSGKALLFMEVLKDKRYCLSYLVIVFSVGSTYLIVPNSATYFVMNLGIGESDIATLFFVGGVVSFVSLQISGFFSDKYGQISINYICTILMCASIYFCFLGRGDMLVLSFAIFMASSSVRTINAMTFTSKIPAPHKRASFLSLQSFFQYLASGGGAFLSSLILVEKEGIL